MRPHALLALALGGCATVPDRAEVDAVIAERIELPAIAEDVPDLTTPRGALTADQAARLAVANNSRVRAALADLGVARAAVLTARAPANPSAEAELYFAEGGDKAIELSIEQSLTSLLFAGRRGAAALAETEAAKLTTAMAVIDVAFEARRAFVAWQASAHRRALARDVLIAADAAYEAARALHASGNFEDLRLYTEQDQLESAKLALHDAEADVATKREALDAAMGLWGAASTEWSAEERLPALAAEAIDGPSVERQALERSLALAALRQRIAGSGDRAGMASIAGWLPDIDVGVAAKREGDDHPWFVGPKLGIELPLFNRGAGVVATFEAETARLEATHAAQAVELRAIARQRAVQAQALAERARHQRDVIQPLKAKIVEETLKHVNAMNASVLDLMRVRREQIDAERSYVDALERGWMARIDVDQLLAGGAPSAASATAVPSDTGSSGASNGDEH